MQSQDSCAPLIIDQPETHAAASFCNCTIDGNHATNAALSLTTSSAGGVLVAKCSATTTFVACTISGNHATRAQLTSGAYPEDFPPQDTVQGGVVYARSQYASVSFDSCIISQNFASSVAGFTSVVRGGVVYAHYRTKVRFLGCDVWANHATSPTFAYGGVTSAVVDQTHIEGYRFSANYASSFKKNEGGGVIRPGELST